jgi:hypothetical protein
MGKARSTVDTPDRLAAKERYKQYQARNNAQTAARRKKPPKVSKQGLTAPAVIAALKKERGILAYAALSLGVSRSVLYTYIQGNSACARVFADERESMGDVAERKLHELVEQGDVNCVKFLLSTVHGARGYASKSAEQPSGDSNRVLTVNVIAIPSGQFLSKEEVAQITIEHEPIPTAPDVP